MSELPGDLKVQVKDCTYFIRRIAPTEYAAVLEVYRQSEDFLALGPIPQASMSMVLQDMELSRREKGWFCGIFDAPGGLVGIIDFVPRDYEGNSQQAYLALLMIAPPFRAQGLGTAVVRLVETVICTDESITAILSGVQVNNPGAIRFWQRNGYRIVGGPELLPDQTTVFHLRKDIGL